jgi:hypothetical protein
MKPELIQRTMILPLFLFGLLLLGCSGSPQSPNDNPADSPTVSGKDPATKTPVKQGVTDESAIEVDVTEVDVTEVNVTEEGSNSAVVLSGRNIDEARLSIVIDNIAQALEAQKLAYDPAKGTDCSGIYHKIKDQVQLKFSELGDESKYHYPTYSQERNTRQIAYWYHENGNLNIVQNGKTDRNLIRPGSVMFFGRTDEKYSDITIEMLTNPGVWSHDKAAGKGKIMHMATVTKVKRDAQGNVEIYTMMHGRNRKYPASRTASNHDGSGGYAKTFAKFPFGNWNQQWVAVANIETLK